ncbi:MAG: DUF523 domain-containing protein [Butyricicoccaceae bacterium]
MNILVSACLLGVHCRYDGGGATHPTVEQLMHIHHLIPFCPEVYGGLPTPRTPSERCGHRVLTRDGADVTAAYEHGAREALALAQRFGCRYAILKARSPSCGSGIIYDGIFSKTLVEGDGVTAQLLKAHGIRVFTEEDDFLHEIG